MEIKQPKTDVRSPWRHLPTAGHIQDVPDARCLDAQRLRSITPKMPAGWNVRVTTFDSEGKPRLVRNFLAYESDKEKAIELVRKRVPVNEGELAEAVAEVAGNEFVRPGMRPGDVRRHSKKADLDEG
jgi:hypothetical protein